MRSPVFHKGPNPLSHIVPPVPFPNVMGMPAFSCTRKLPNAGPRTLQEAKIDPEKAICATLVSLQPTASQERVLLWKNVFTDLEALVLGVKADFLFEPPSCGRRAGCVAHPGCQDAVLP